MAVEPHWLRVMFGVWSRGKIDAAALAQARSDWEARKATRPRLSEELGTAIEGTGGTLFVQGTVGVLVIDGPLFRHANLFTEYSGGTTYDALHRGLDAAVAHRQVAKILLLMRSPGGEAAGVNELAKHIRDVDENHKPVYAFADNMCASAAYWLASQARHITAEETAEIGSIGVRCGIVDYSAADEMMGIREIEVISSQSPAKRSNPVTDDVVGRLQVRIDDLADIFIAAVAEGRGVDVDKVLEDFGQGGVMIASKALAAGLIDEIGNFTGTLTAIAAAPQNGRAVARAGGKAMATIEKERPTAGEGPEWQCSGCNEMMGASAKAFCAKCSEDDDEEDDDEEDEEEARALGLDAHAAADVRRARMLALAAFERDVLAAVGASAHVDALKSLTDAVAAQGKVAELEASASKARAEEQRTQLRGMFERGLMGAPGKSATLSLGAIQKRVPTVLRGETKKAYLAAMEKLAVDADAAKPPRGITATEVVAAACSVPMSAEDLEAIGELIATSDPVAAPTFVEPERNPGAESAEMSEIETKVAEAAKQARATLDRNKAK
jgi:signal peptide peptidase SppA